MTQGTSAYIVDAVRTPFLLAKTSGMLEPVEMGVHLVRSLLLGRSTIDPDAVDLVLMGTAFPERDQGGNIGRMIVMHPQSGLPLKTAGRVVSSFCTSSLNALDDADSLIRTGKADIVLAGGVESMIRVAADATIPLNKAIYEIYPKGFLDMGVTAENLVAKYNISAQAQAEFAVRSHQLAAKAWDEGFFNNRVIPIWGSHHGEAVCFDRDNCIRPDTSVESIMGLKAAFKTGGTVNAGNSSPVTNGASLLMVVSEEALNKYNLTPLARVVSSGEVAVSPEIMGIGPVPAAKQALNRAVLTMDDMTFLEINEAFAAQNLAVQAEGAKQGIPFETEKLNIKGGATALGHPLGASGGRLAMQLIDIFREKGGRYGMIGACAANGTGKVVILENLQPQPRLGQ